MTGSTPDSASCVFCWWLAISLRRLPSTVCSPASLPKDWVCRVFVLLYVGHVIGYTVTNMTAQTIPAIMTNDPTQRPTIGVWTTAFNYLVPMAMSMVMNVVLLPKFGGQYNQAFLSAACAITLVVAAVGTLLVCLGVSSYDKPETFWEPRSLSAEMGILSK